MIYDSVTLVDQCEGHTGTAGSPAGAPAGAAAFRVAGAKVDRRGRIVVREADRRAPVGTLSVVLDACVSVRAPLVSLRA